MQRLVLGLLVLAVVGAGATVLLVNRYIDRRIQTTEKKVEQVQPSKVVLVAKVNIPIGKKITPADLQWLPWPDKGVQENFLAANRPDGGKAAKMIGAIARRGIIKGTPMTAEAVFRTTTPGFLAGALDPHMRAISISVTPESGTAGFIMPGDRVDVILMQDVKRNLQEKTSGKEESFRPYLRYAAETVLQDIRVLAVDQKVNDFEKKAQISKTVTLEVTPKQAETMAVAKALGKIGLALRSLVDDRSVAAANADEKPAAASGMAIGEKPAVMAKAMPGEGGAAEAPTVTTDLEISPMLAASVATASGPTKVTRQVRRRGAQIRIYRGGQPSTVNF